MPLTIAVNASQIEDRASRDPAIARRRRSEETMEEDLVLVIVMAGLSVWAVRAFVVGWRRSPNR